MYPPLEIGVAFQVGNIRKPNFHPKLAKGGAVTFFVRLGCRGSFFETYVQIAILLVPVKDVSDFQFAFCHRAVLVAKRLIPFLGELKILGF